jgi:signal transduction histidine kinase
MAAISWYTQRYIGNQIVLLVKATGRISSGDLHTPVVPVSEDELGQLASSVEYMRQNLNDSREALDRAHQKNLSSERHATIGKLAAGIIHDFKNPMAIIKGTAELIDGKIDDKARVITYSKRIREQVDAMVELTRDVLEYSRGSVRLEKSVVAVVTYLRDLQQCHSHQFNEAEIDLRLEDGPDIAVSLDASRLKRVFDNILNNAREACASGSRVSIGWHSHDDGLVIEVSDSGPGIPEDIVSTLFDPFVTSGKANGTGLGLAIAKKIVEDHGGRISVASSPGIGTTFAISLPLEKNMTPQDVHQVQRG